MLKFTLKLLSVLAIAAPCAAATFTVTSNADTAGASCAATCTLRQAITAANANADSDSISFNVVNGGGEVLIQPATPLPLITQPLSIDGYTQTGAEVNTAVSGSNAELRVRLHGAAIATSAIAGFSACASAISIRGLSITGFTTSGSAAIRSGGGGCATATQVSVLGNFIGLRTDGITADANFSGVEANAAIVHVGSANLADRNVIGSTSQQAILLSNSGASGSSVSNNLIGSTRLGDSAQPVGKGILLGILVSNVSIGSVASPNVIANVGNGVGVQVGNGSNNVATANRFHGLSSPIDLSAAGGTVTANDLDDIDTGPNGLQNFPVIQSVQRIAGGVRVQGTLDVPAASNNAPYTLSFYASTACAASGNGPGERFLGNFPANFTQGSGENFSIDVLTQDLLPTGAVLTAAVTGPEGSSEFSACAAVPAGTAGFVVTTPGTATGGSCGGACTLVQAINAANARAGTDTVAFHLPGSGAQLLRGDNLPALKDGLILDGYTQPGAAANTDPLRSNAQIKIELFSSGATVGGLYTCGSNITVRGLALTGTQTLITKFDPVTFSCAVFGTNVRVLGNFVGIKPDGSDSLGSSNGVLITDTVATIGTAAPADRNVVGHGISGISLTGAVAGTLIQGNLIGSDPTGLLNRGNTSGILLGTGATGVHIGGSGAQANLIAFNSVGIAAFSSAGSGNRLFGNHFQANTALAIDLSTQASQGDGITANDLNDADTGANLLQNFPVLSAASQIGNSLRIQGQLDVPVATSNASYTLAFYESAGCDASGNGEGEIFLGAQAVSLSGAAESFSVTLPIAPNPQALQITATATDPLGNTSEFSACRLASALPEIIFQSRFE